MSSLSIEPSQFLKSSLEVRYRGKDFMQLNRG